MKLYSNYKPYVDNIMKLETVLLDTERNLQEFNTQIRVLFDESLFDKMVKASKGALEDGDDEHWKSAREEYVQCFDNMLRKSRLK